MLVRAAIAAEVAGDAQAAAVLIMRSVALARGSGAVGPAELARTVGPR